MAYRTPPFITPFAIVSIVLGLAATNVVADKVAPVKSKTEQTSQVDSSSVTSGSSSLRQSSSSTHPESSQSVKESSNSVQESTDDNSQKIGRAHV